MRYAHFLIVSYYFKALTMVSGEINDDQDQVNLQEDLNELNKWANKLMATEF